MEYDKDKVDEMTLALLYLTSTHDQYGTRAWKGLERETFDRLIEKGFSATREANHRRWR